MPSYTFTSPDGKSYTVNGPEGSTPEQAWGVLQQQLGMQQAPAESEGILSGLMKNAAKVEASKDAVFGQAKSAMAPKPATPFEQPAVDAMGNPIGMAEQPVEQPQGLAAIAPKKPSELAPGEEFKKGVAGAFNVALPSMWEQAGVMKDVGALGTVQKRLDLFGKIDQGEITDFDQLRGLDLTTSQARSYLGATPEMREKMKERLTGEVAKRTDFVKASIGTLAQYQKEMEQYKGRTTDLTDVEGIKDFANWLSYNVGSGAVQMAPIMVAAATTGPGGVALLGTGMGVSEAVGNRMDALAPKLEGLNDDQKAAAVIDYVTKTGDTSLAVGVISGAFDTVLGPAATLAKRGLSQVVKGETRKEALKAGVKEIPKQMGEEFITGGAQEATQIAGAVREGETPEFFNEENVKKIINAAAAEAAGAVGGGGATTAARVYGANKAEKSKEDLLKQAFEVPAGEERATYTKPEATDLESLARSKGFLTPQAPQTVEDLIKETAPASESQDLNAMLAELEAQLEGKPAPAKAAQPVVEAPVAEEPVVKESLTPAAEDEQLALLEKQLATPTELELEESVAAEAPVETPKVEPTQPAVDLIEESSKYDTPEMRLKQSDAFGVDLATDIFNEMESHGRAAARNRGLTDGYAKKKDAFGAASDAATIAFGTGDFGVFEPFATTFPKVAKKLKAHLATETKAEPAAAPVATNLQVAEKDIKGKHDVINTASDFNDAEFGWLDADNKLHMQYADGTPVKHYAGDKTPTGVANLTPITNADEARAAVDAGKQFVTVGEDSTAVKEAPVAKDDRKAVLDAYKAFYTTDAKVGEGAATAKDTAQFKLERAISTATDSGQPVNVIRTKGQIELRSVDQELPKGGKLIGTIQPDPSYKYKTNAQSQQGKAQAKAAKPKTGLDKVSHLRKSSWEKNPLMAWLADKGLFYKKGERDNMMAEFNGGKQKMISGYGPMFKSSGLRIDALLPIAIQDGFVPQDATESDLYSLIQQAFSGKKIEALYQEQGQEDLAKKFEERMAQEEPGYEERAGQSDAEWYGMSEDEYVNVMASEVAELSPEEMAALDESVRDLSEVPASNVSMRAAMEALGFTEEEIQNEERRTTAKTDEAAARKETQGNEPSEAAPALELETQTAEDLKAKQDEIDRLTKENERLAKQAEAKAKADAEREEFVLTGSDRPADVAAAQGQKDIFGAMEEEAPAADAAVTKLQKVAESLLDSPRTKETVDEVEYEGKTYESRTRSYEGRLFGSELQLLRDTVGNANSVTLVNEPERVLTLQLTGKQVGQGRDMRITETVYTPKQEAATGELVTFTHRTDTEPGKGQVSGYYPGTYSYETGTDVAIPAKGGKNEFTGELKESDIYTLKDADALKREASEAGFEYRQASGNSEIRYLQSLGYKAMRRGPEIIVFDAKDANFKKAKPEVASEVVGPAEKPAAPQLTREPVTIEGEFTEVGEEKQRALITTQVNKLSDAQTSTLEKFYGFARDTEEFANAVRQDVVNFITKGATYVNGKIRAIIRSMANGVLSVAVAFNPQFVSMPYTIAVPQFETRIEQVMQEVPASVQKQMSEDAKRAYATIYPAIKGELTKNDKFFIVADKQTANTFVFKPDGTPFMVSKTLFGAGIGDFVKGNNNIVSNRITPAGLFDLGLRDAKRSVDEAATAGEYDFGKVFVLDKSQKGANGFYSTTIMHSVWTKETDAKQRLAALQKPGAEDSRYSFGCINVDKATYGQLVENNLAQMDGAKIFIVPENGTDVMSFVNGEATYSTDIIRQRAEPVTKETKVEVERAAPKAETERTVAAKEEEGPVYNDIFATKPIFDEEKKRSPSFKRKVAKLNRDHQNGKISTEQMVNEVDWALKQAENDRLSKELPKKERGYLEIVRRLAEATKRGDISKESFDLATWFMRNNESLVDDLGVSIRGKGKDGVGGQYETIRRIMFLVKGSGSNLTVVHEILHHLERMMPVKVQQAIRKAWSNQLLAAQKKAKTPAEQLYFKLLIDGHYGQNNFDFVDVPEGEMSKVFMKALAELDFNHPGSKSSFELAETLLKMGEVPISNYEYFNPSEFWAVNGSDIVKGRFDAVQGGVLARLKNWLKELAQKIKGMVGMNSDASIIKALDSLSKADGTFVTKDMLGEGEYKSVRRNYEGNEAPAASWESPEESKMDNLIYKFQDKLIDTKRVIQSIKKTSGEIADNWDVYLKEELFHGRAAKRTQDFLNREMLPILEEMKDKGVTLAQFEEYLHMRHAEERNALVAKRNPKLQDQGSGVKTAEAVKYLADLTPEQNKVFESLARKFDKIIDNTQKLLVESGLETQETIDAWNGAYEHYVPLMRDDLDFKHHGKGLGGGYSTRGGSSKSVVGSTKKVIDIFANVALQRERAITRSEKARVGRALYGLAIKNPNPGFWLPINPDAIKNKEKLAAELEALGLSPEDAENIIQEPKVPSIDKKTGLVKYQVNPLMRDSDNVFPVRINGEDRYIFFNTSDERAIRMVEALKNLDPDQLGGFLGSVAVVTRWMASVNTQFNPVFGLWNFARDVQGAAFNLTTTDIAGHEKEVLDGVLPALKGIYTDLRANRKKKAGDSEWAKLFEQYELAGGQTGYRDQFNQSERRANIVKREMDKLNHGNVRKAAEAVFNWLSDYNDAMENAVRLSAFKVALDQGLSEERAASIAKNLTVNFNRKGASSPTLQSLYAFFNAAVQGSTRLVETLRGPAGKKIMAGGMAIGVAQAIALAMAGFDDDEPPEFLKNKNLIIPVPGGDYLIIPMPLGFNIFPGVGRLTTEYVLGQAGLITGAKGAGEKLISIASLVIDAFNPLGSGSILQMAAPTVADPLFAVFGSNRDAFGRPISKEDRATAPTPGYTRSRENATWFSKQLAEFLNYVSSPMGTKYTKGLISPTADQIDYLIGQYTGGVGRELMKGAQFGAAVVKGETGDLPSYKVPVVGKLYGETESPAAVSAKFYENVTKLAEHENEIKMRIKNKDDTREYRAEHPEVRFIHRANNLENQITAINKQKKALQEREAPEERIKKLDERKTKLMKDFNDQIKKLERQ